MNNLPVVRTKEIVNLDDLYQYEPGFNYLIKSDFVSTAPKFIEKSEISQDQFDNMMRQMISEHVESLPHRQVVLMPKMDEHNTTIIINVAPVVSSA